MICKYYIFPCPLASTRSVSHVPLSSLESAAVIGPRNPPKLESPIPDTDCPIVGVLSVIWGRVTESSIKSVSLSIITLI